MSTLTARASWLLAATSGLWSAVLAGLDLDDRWWLATLIGALFAVSTWLLRSHPWIGVIGTAGGALLTGIIGLPPENAAPLGPALIALAVIGSARPLRESIWAVPIVLAAAAVSAEWNLLSIVVGFVILLAPWWFGTLVRARDLRRRAAADRALELARTDPVALAAAAAADEHDAVSAEIIEVIGASVDRMTAIARQARALLPAHALDEIHATGQAASRRLRSLLERLRGDEASESVTAREFARPAPDAPGRWRVKDIVATVAPALLMLADLLLLPALMRAFAEQDVPAAAPLSFHLVVVLPLVVAVLIRRRWIVAALGCAFAALLASSFVDPGGAGMGREGLWLAIAVAALSWSAGVAASRASTIAWLLVTVSVVTLIALESPGNLPIQITMLVMPFLAGAAWTGHHLEEAGYVNAAQVRTAELDSAMRRAVADERLRLARNLHDAAGHAVGTMMMQTNAARVLRERDPDGARAALDAIVEVGVSANTELRELGAVTGSGIRPAPNLEADLRSLADSAERDGSRVRLHLAISSTLSPDDAVLIRRTVREGLANAVRHAPGSTVHVAVQATGERVSVTVRNGAATAVPTTGIGTGLGLRGLREFVADRGGEISARPDGAGFRLVVSFAAAAPTRMVEP